MTPSRCSPGRVTEDLLSEDVSRCLEREQGTLARLISPFTEFVLLGAGMLGRKVLRALREHGIEPLALCDNDSRKWGADVEGMKVLAPQEAAMMFGARAVFVVTIWAPRHSYLATAERLRAIGCSKVVPFIPLVWKYPDSLLPHYQFELPSRILRAAHEIQQLFDTLADEESRRQFAGHLQWRLWLDYSALPAPAPDTQYFDSELARPTPAEVLVDCGAFDGDTIRSFLRGRGPDFNMVYAYEPDPSNFAKLLQCHESLANDIRKRIWIRQYAVGARTERVSFGSTGSMAAAVCSDDRFSVECVALDDEVFEAAPTLLKYDVEGYEAEALSGSTRLISESHPVVAVCVYHKPSDLWKIPLQLRAITPNARLLLRTHDYDGLEIVCYSVPNGR